MKIFISYSVDDIRLVDTIASYISRHAEVYYWDKSKSPGSEIWPLIYQWIDQSDLVIALITDNTIRRAMAVGNELEHAKAQQRLIVPLITPNVRSSDLGILGGVVYERIDPHNIFPALLAAERAVLQRKQELQNQRALLFIIGGALALALANSGE